jgi:hypothetical protein
MGRFSSPDPLGNFVADVGNPQSWNLYSYVWNNPLVNVDPTGTTCVSVSHPDGSTGQADNGDGQGCKAAEVSPTKDGKPPTDTNDITPQEANFSYFDPKFNTHGDPNDKTQVEQQQELGNAVYRRATHDLGCVGIPLGAGDASGALFVSGQPTAGFRSPVTGRLCVRYSGMAPLRYSELAPPSCSLSRQAW